LSEQPNLQVPARDIPVPQHLSAQAQAFLSLPRPAETQPYPPLDDAEAWRRLIAERDQMILQMMRERMPELPCTITELREGEALAYEIVPDGVKADDRRVYLDIHGGALIFGSGEVCKSMAMGTVFRHMVRVVSVDYRIAPDHPHPAALDDCIAFYRALLRDHAPSEIIVGGGSAGANLAAALMLRARDEGLPLPAALVLISPEADLTESGDSFNTNAVIDGMGSLMPINLLYANGTPLENPYLSPLFGDFTKGYPPTLITAGTRDLFLSNAARLHRALRNAEIPAELHIQEGAVHGAFGGAPEDAEIERELQLFCEKHWGS
jgi:acetyl esterase/lipase